MCCLKAKMNDMKRIFAVLTFTGICLGAINSSAQSDSTVTSPKNMKSPHNDREHHRGNGHHTGFRLFHHKHHGRYGHHEQKKTHSHREGDSKDKQDLIKK